MGAASGRMVPKFALTYTQAQGPGRGDEKRALESSALDDEKEGRETPSFPAGRKVSNPPT